MLFNVSYHFERVPTFMQNYVGNLFMASRHGAADVFNARIDAVNIEWDETGEPCGSGPYLEDINPESVQFIKVRIQPAIDELVNKKNKILNICVDECGDLIGRLKWDDRSKVSITLEEVK